MRGGEGGRSERNEGGRKEDWEEGRRGREERLRERVCCSFTVCCGVIQPLLSLLRPSTGESEGGWIEGGIRGRGENRVVH